jgi:BASS family bile acid:Na+ symporter
MIQHKNGLSRLAEALQYSFLPLLIAVYFLAAINPEFGLWAKQFVVVESGGTKVSLTMILLAALLFNASLGVSTADLGSIMRRPFPLFAGLTVNLLVPLGFLIALRFLLMAVWHDNQEANCLLLGLAVVVSMPVAGSSTAWSQNSNGNVALSLGLVFVSTVLSPLTTPFVISGFGGLTNGDQAHALQTLSGQGTGQFLVICVALPMAFGVLVRFVVGSRSIARLKPALKLANSVLLLFLCYANASVALPQAVAHPDWDFLALVMVSVTGLCLTAFASGWVVAKALGVSEQDQKSLIFGLGMNNNDTGMVLAASALFTLPWAIVPVLAYNLVQHIVASGFSRSMRSTGNSSHAVSTTMIGNGFIHRLQKLVRRMMLANYASLHASASLKLSGC